MRGPNDEDYEVDDAAEDTGVSVEEAEWTWEEAQDDYDRG